MTGLSFKTEFRIEFLTPGSRGTKVLGNIPAIWKKYEFLINKYENVGLKHYNGLKSFIERSNDMQDVYKCIEEYNPGKNIKH